MLMDLGFEQWQAYVIPPSDAALDSVAVVTEGLTRNICALQRANMCAASEGWRTCTGKAGDK